MMNNEWFVTRYSAEYWKSRTNASVVQLSKLNDIKYRTEYGLYLAEGVKLVDEALTYSTPKTLIVSEEALDDANGQKNAIIQLVEKGNAADCRVVLASKEVFSKISTEKAPQGIIAVLPVPERKAPVFCPQGRYLLLDNIQDPGNLGTILRSVAAFGFDGAVCFSCADVFSPKTVRASMGAVFRVPVWKTDDLFKTVQSLRAGNHRVLAAALAQDCLCAGNTTLYSNDCIVIGNEGHGVDPCIIAGCDAVIRIPMTGNTESLNASVAASILLWEYYRSFS